MKKTIEINEQPADIMPAQTKVTFVDGKVFCENTAGEMVECPIATDGLAYVLPANTANRKWLAVKKVETLIANGTTELILDYRATRTIGKTGKHIPNEKLISYLPDDLQAEYKAIIDRAIAAREAAKNKPMTELEKAEAKLIRAQAALDKLLAQAAE